MPDLVGGMRQRGPERTGPVAVVLHEMQGHALSGLGADAGQAAQGARERVEAGERFLRRHGSVHKASDGGAPARRVRLWSQNGSLNPGGSGSPAVSPAIFS